MPARAQWHAMIRQRIGTVLDWAKAAGHRSGDNPIDGVTEGLPKQTDRDIHHTALPYSELPGFLCALAEHSASEPIKLGLEFLILTATRASEVLLAKWDKLDLEAKVWTVPASRMKARKPHRVPLSNRCLELLYEAQRLRCSDYMFPGTMKDKPVSNMSFLMVLRRMGLNVTGTAFARHSAIGLQSKHTFLARYVKPH